MQSHTQVAVLVRQVPEVASPDWEPFSPGGEPAGWVTRAFGSGELSSGRIDRTAFWRHDGGELIYAPAQTELVVILEGRVELLFEGEPVAEFRAGQTALVPAGFTGIWATREPVTKFSVVFASDSSPEA